MISNNPPEQGQLVDVRQRRFVVLEVKKSALPQDVLKPISENLQHLVTLSSVDDDGLGEELQVVWELEPGARVFEKMALPEPTGFDDPERLDAFIDAVRWGAVSSADVRSLQAPFRSGVEREDYQLDPVVRALQMPRVNLLIADDVGLGKTIEAGLTAQELILRHRVRTILVVCPASLQIQWQDQMRDKFGLEFRIVDSSSMRNLRRNRGLHVNPWTHFPRLITSFDFLKRETPMRLFSEILPDKGESAFPRKFDLLILDEAHNVAPSGAGYYATDSLRTTAIRTIAPHFEHKMFLTATPHNGYSESFTALLELLDNQRFARGVPPDRRQLEVVMVRRLKSELKLKWDGTSQFAERKIEPIEVDYSETEKKTHKLLQEYTELRRKNISDDTEKFATEFVLKLLKKRLFSSPAAFAATLGKHEDTIKAGKKQKDSTSKPTIGILRRQVEEIEEDYADDNDYEEATGEVVQVATRTFRDLHEDEKRVLRELRDFADNAKNRPDSKADELIKWLGKNIKPNGKWSNRRVLIFTEYRATQKWLQNLLAHHGFTEGNRLLTLYGGMSSEDRESIKAAFQADPEESSVRILLATDAASEGIDLQNFCSDLIHYEIPWNPNRMEQRNGRLDRHGQRAPNVFVYHFVGNGYNLRSHKIFKTPGDLEGDIEFLMRAAIKIETIREDLGKVGPVIARQVEEAMLGRRKELDTSKTESDNEPIRKMLKFERDLRKRIEELRENLRETEKELRFSPQNIQKVVEIGLELAGQSALREAEIKGLWPDSTGRIKKCPVFHLPPLSGSWSQCCEGLEHPHTRKIRPIVFDEVLAKGRDDVVLAHLNHRLVQMCLRLLRAEVWELEERKKLHRVTARIVPDSVLQTPAVIAHGRLVVLGGDNQRLHEELIAAGGTLKEGKFARMNVGEVNAALESATRHEAPDPLKKRLAKLWPSFEKQLSAALEARMRDRTKNLQSKLDERAEKETKDITAILKELERSILQELNAPATTQLELWTSSEREQFERNKSDLHERVKKIPAEIEQETKAVRDRYADPTPRLFPLAITFLVPEKIAREAEGDR